MWDVFFLSVLVAVLFLYLPGFFFMRAFRIAPVAGLAVAPVVTLAVYSLLCVVYSKIGVYCSWLMLFVPSLVVSIILLALLRIVRRGKATRIDLVASGRGLMGFSPRATDWAILGLYVCVGILVTLLVFVRTFDGPGSFVQEYDNVYHLGVIRTFIESGDWSSLNASLYAGGADTGFAPLNTIEFYPSAWHCVASLIVSAIGAPITLAANASNFVFIAIVFPLSTFLLIRHLFARIPKIVFFGAFCTLAFSAYPWGFLMFGPLYSNLSSFAVLPSVAFCFISLFSPQADSRTRIASGILFFSGLISLLFTQPNAVFTMGVFLIPFCVVQVARLSDRLRLPENRRLVVKVVLCALFLVLVILLWTALFNAPFMQKVVTHNWPAFISKSQAAINAILLSFNVPAPQVVLSFFVILGIVYTLFKREYLWMSCSFVIMGVLYIVDVSSDELIKFFLTGFWYTDSYRVAASATLFAIPLACTGLFFASELGCGLLKWITGKTGVPGLHKLFAPCAVVVVFLVATFYPSYAIPGRYEVRTAFGVVGERLSTVNKTEGPRVYNQKEREFVHKVERTIPAGSVVINDPNDGSAFAYGADGLNAYYRYLRTYGEDSESEESRIIRGHLKEIGSNDEVRAAVDKVGAEYLLLLDQGDVQGEEPHLFTYDPGNWQGVDLVDDLTPGFEVVLSEGDMRLYKISNTA